MLNKHMLLQHSYYCIKFRDAHIAQLWLSKINELVAKHNRQLMDETNEMFLVLKKSHSFHLKHLSWIKEKLLSEFHQTSLRQQQQQQQQQRMTMLNMSSSSSSSSPISSQSQAQPYAAATGSLLRIDQIKNLDFLKSQLRNKPVLLALTSNSLLVYEQVPKSIDDWLQPSVSYSLLITRLIIQPTHYFTATNRGGAGGGGGNVTASATVDTIHNNNNNNANNSNNDNLYFLTRHGTSAGVTSHLFQCLHANDYRIWTELIEKQTFAAVDSIKHVDFRKSHIFRFDFNNKKQLIDLCAIVLKLVHGITASAS